MPTRLYYVTYQGNSFDTHVQQADLHSRLLMYTADAVRGFMEDVKRIGRADEVAVMIFTEFGRRVEENGSLGTDHGTATPMFVVGKGVKGGFYGTASEPHRSRRRQHEDDDRLPARLRDADQGVARLRRHRDGAEGQLRPARRVRVDVTPSRAKASAELCSAKASAERRCYDRRVKRRVVVNDKMQRGYVYYRTEPAGRNFAPDFTPELTPKQMLRLGVFGGKYMTDCRDGISGALVRAARSCRPNGTTPG